MKTNILLSCLVITFCSSVSLTARAQAVNVNDSLALVDIYNSTNGPNWYDNTNWLSANPVRTWHGVYVMDSTVFELNLGFNNLTGTLPASIGNFTNLNLLFMNTNKISGQIPASVGNLKSLTVLNMLRNSFTGQIPSSINKLKNLDYLGLSYNGLTGSLPFTFNTFARATTIDVSNNQLRQTTNVDYTGTRKLRLNLFLDYNRFTFDGLEAAVKATYIRGLGISSQAPLSIHHSGNQLSVYAGGTLSNNTYNWYKVGQANPTTITGDSTFVPAESGQYYATITNSVVGAALTLTTDTVSYTAALQKALSVSVYPNPVKGVLTITGLDAKSICTITIADVSGNVQMNTVARQQSSVKYDVSRLKQGSYVLSVSNGQEVKTLNFMKE